MSDELNNLRDQRIEAELEEVLGGVRPPDMSKDVLRRVRGEASGCGAGASPASGMNQNTGGTPALSLDDARETLRHKRGIWAAAACVVVGMGLMAWSGLSRLGQRDGAPIADNGGEKIEKRAANGEGGPAALQTATVGEVELTPVVVKSLEEFDALPADTKAIALGGRGDGANEIAPKLLRLTALEYLDISHNEKLNCPGTLSDETLGTLAALPALKYLNLSHQADVTGTGFQSFAGHPALTTVTCDGCGLTDEGAAALSNIPNLKALTLTNTNVSDVGLSRLTKIHTLETLVLDGCSRITPEGVAAISVLPNLSDLGLNGVEVGDKGLEAMANIFTLRRLGMSFPDDRITGVTHDGGALVLNRRDGIGATDVGVIHLARLTSLEYLDLSGNERRGRPITNTCGTGTIYHHITANGLRTLASMPSLKTLKLAHTLTINDDGLRVLSGGAANLQTVDLTGCTNVSRRAMAEFLHALPNCRITAPEGAVYVEQPEDMTAPVVNNTGDTPTPVDTVNVVEAPVLAAAKLARCWVEAGLKAGMTVFEVENLKVNNAAWSYRLSGEPSVRRYRFSLTSGEEPGADAPVLIIFCDNHPQGSEFGKVHKAVLQAHGYDIVLAVAGANELTKTDMANTLRFWTDRLAGLGLKPGAAKEAVETALVPFNPTTHFNEKIQYQAVGYKHGGYHYMEYCYTIKDDICAPANSYGVVARYGYTDDRPPTEGGCRALGGLKWFGVGDVPRITEPGHDDLELCSPHGPAPAQTAPHNKAEAKQMLGRTSAITITLHRRTHDDQDGALATVTISDGAEICKLVDEVVASFDRPLEQLPAGPRLLRECPITIEFNMGDCVASATYDGNFRFSRPSGVDGGDFGLSLELKSILDPYVVSLHEKDQPRKTKVVAAFINDATKAVIALDLTRAECNGVPMPITITDATALGILKGGAKRSLNVQEPDLTFPKDAGTPLIITFYAADGKELKTAYDSVLFQTANKQLGMERGLVCGVSVELRVALEPYMERLGQPKTPAIDPALQTAAAWLGIDGKTYQGNAVG